MNVEREDRHGNADDHLNRLAAREVDVRPEREANGDEAFGRHGDQKSDGKMDGVVEGEQDQFTRPDARRIDVTTQPPQEGYHQCHCVTAADGAHIQTRAVLAHALAERHDQRENVGDDAGQSNEHLVVETDSMVNVELYVVNCCISGLQTGHVCVV